MCHSESSEESLYSAIDRDVLVALRSIAPSEPLGVAEAYLKDMRHDIFALLGADVADHFVRLLTSQIRVTDTRNAENSLVLLGFCRAAFVLFSHRHESRFGCSRGGTSSL